MAQIMTLSPCISTAYKSIFSMYIAMWQIVFHSWIPLVQLAHHVKEFIHIFHKTCLEITNTATNL